MALQTGIELQDNFSRVFYGIVNSVNLAVSAMFDMQQAMNANIDTTSLQSAQSEINQATAAVNQLNSALANMGTPHMPENPTEPQWTNQSNIQVFDNTGTQRLINEMFSLKDISEDVFRNQQRIDEQALGMEILPSNASWDINATRQRLTELSTQLRNLRGQDISLLGDDGAEQMNGQYEAIRTNMNNIVNLQAQLDQALQEGDVSGLNQGYNQLNNMITQVEQQARNARQTLDSLTNIQWNSSGGIEVFSGSGTDRFRQEIQSANIMMQQLNATQQFIQQTTNTMDILPASAIQDINSIGVRIQGIQQRISQIESNPLNMGTDTANRQLEQLRSQLDRAIQEQNQLNSALSNMDIRAANSAYMRLSQTIGNTERYIRDNVDEQGRFNQEIRQGTAQSGELANMIKRVAAAYVSIRSIRSFLDISDELVQNTARIDLMNDGLQTTEELTNMIYASAQNARGSFSDMTSVVARFGNNAKDAFGSSEEVVAFANLIQKQMTIAGASTNEASNAMIQLSQALGSGVLRGDELNSIFEQAPNLIQNIADYLKVPIGDIREMAQEGELSAGVVKAAIFSATDEINAQFESMPMTWEQNWQLMKNTATMAFQPVLERINNIANSEGFQTFANRVIEGMAIIANIVLTVFELIGDFGGFVVDNWSIISPAIYAVIAALSIYAAYLAITKGAEIASKAVKVIAMFASYAHAAATRKEASETAKATAAQYGFNTALLASPLTWIIIMIIAVIAIIYTVIAIINKATNSTISATGIIAGVFTTLAAHILNTFAIPIQNIIASLVNFFGNAFNDPISSIKILFYDMVLTVLGYIKNLAEGIETLINKIPGIEIDITSGLDKFYDKLEEAQQAVKDKSGWVEYMKKWDYIDYEAAFNKGYDFGEKIDDKISEFSLSDIFGETDVPNPDDYAYVFDGSNTDDYLSNISDNTDDISDSLEISEENLKYLRDLAEQDAVNRFTTAEITIEQNNTNNIKSEMDLDGVISGMTDAVNEAISIATEGVH